MTEGEAAGLARHDLVRVDPEAWADCLAERRDLDGVPHLADWARLGRPVIVRRRNPGEPTDHIPVGLPLPPAAGKRRIGLALSAAAASRHPPISLETSREAAPQAWRPVLDELVGLGSEYGLVPNVFGSLLWQALTDLPYLGPGSDLDLLWPVPGRVDRRFLRTLARIDAGAVMRLDGEIVLPDGAGINWRELLDSPEGGTVLCKARENLALLPAGPFLSQATS
ncbi:malonate decarboxylase holo-[acyl-carrier-protein] synthase [Methylobacterium sp. 77]|uniref:malonate decarboxylase holo-[acyl-carrier-protein] synthase n=1 Tax=Methylobacterium sp. 77 TaxID=1101192 RepID=UPI000361FFD0|nr:malonate decarboxylase holo-[acyl-carrier-protein] synthase [Methylobacterium sp. 77]